MHLPLISAPHTCVQTKGALAAAAAASAVAAQVARGRGRAALARGAFVSAAAPGYVTPGNDASTPSVVYLSNGMFVGICLCHSIDIFWGGTSLQLSPVVKLEISHAA